MSKTLPFRRDPFRSYLYSFLCGPRLSKTPRLFLADVSNRPRRLSPSAPRSPARGTTGWARTWCPSTRPCPRPWTRATRRRRCSCCGAWRRRPEPKTKGADTAHAFLFLFACVCFCVFVVFFCCVCVFFLFAGGLVSGDLKWLLKKELGFRGGHSQVTSPPRFVRGCFGSSLGTTGRYVQLQLVVWVFGSFF